MFRTDESSKQTESNVKYESIRRDKLIHGKSLMNYKSLLLLGAIALSSNAFAGSLHCDNAKVQHVGYHADNRLRVQLDNMNFGVFFCNPEEEWTVSGTTYTMGPETCKALYSTFLAAKLSGDTIARVHFDGDAVPSSCDGWASEWQSAVIRYVKF